MRMQLRVRNGMQLKEFDPFWCLLSTDRVIGTVAVK